MPSEKLTRILVAKSQFSATDIDRMTEAEGWRWVYAQARPSTEKLPTICFTGFSAAEKQVLCAAAEGAHLRVVHTVNASLSFLCVGDNAGPAKLVKAKEHEVLIMTRQEFDSFLENGELPV
jgi:BRCT domain type II-containing protein